MGKKPSEWDKLKSYILDIFRLQCSKCYEMAIMEVNA